MLLDWMRLLSSELPMISSAVEKSHQWPQDGQRNNPDGITASLQCPTGSPPAATLRTSSDKLAPRLATHTHTLTVSFYRPIRRNHLTFLPPAVTCCKIYTYMPTVYTNEQFGKNYENQLDAAVFVGRDASSDFGRTRSTDSSYWNCSTWWSCTEQSPTESDWCYNIQNKN